MIHPTRRLTRRLKAATALAAIGLATFVTSAYAFEVSYGGYNICGDNCYIQSPGSAHTFVRNLGSTSGSGYLACQLFNYSGFNRVSHGNGGCEVTAPSQPYKNGRVYNQSGSTRVVSGFAAT